MRSFLLALSLLILSAGWLSAQDTKSDFKTGRKEFRWERYYNAIEPLKRVVEAEPENAEALYMLGVCYLNGRDFHQGHLYLERAKEAAAPELPAKDFEYWYGMALHDDGNYDEAIKYYEQYLETLPNKGERHDNCVALIGQAKTAKSFEDKPWGYKVDNLGDSLNSPFADHSPLMTEKGDMLIFTSQRPYQGNIQDPDGHYYETIFFSRLQPDSTWGEPQAIRGQLDGHGHDACIQLYDNDTKMLIYREARRGDIFEAEFDGETWSKPKRIEGINTRQYEVDATLSADGMTMYYSTDAYNSNNDLDIYVTTKKDDGSWSDPVSVGNKINTRANEDAPYLSRDGQRLYFAADGPGSMGGYDIFVSELQPDGSWGEPRNLGPPVNSVGHDIYFHETSIPDMALFASYRSGGLGELDLYWALKLHDVPCRLDAPMACDSAQVAGYVVSYQTLDKHYMHRNEETKFYENPTLYAGLPYHVTVYDGEEVVGEDTLVFEKEEGQVLAQAFIEVACVKDTLVPDTTQTCTREFQTLYFAFNRHSLSTDAKSELDSLVAFMNEFPTVKAEFKGYTDNVGSDSYNKTLAYNRAKSAGQYLVGKGISKERLSFTGFGKAEFIAPNDTEEGRAKNRRVEIRLVCPGPQSE